MTSVDWLVTGCAGMIGSRVAHHLLERGERVTGLDALAPEKDPELKRWRLKQLDGRQGWSFRRGDVRARVRHL